MTIPNPVSGEIITSAWGQAVADAVNPGAWTAVTLSAGWADFAGGYQAAQYRRVGDRVELRGLVKRSGSALAANVQSDLWAVPVGFRPPADNIISARCAIALTGAFTVQYKSASGVLVAFIEAGGASLPDQGWVTLDGISWSIA